MRETFQEDAQNPNEANSATIALMTVASVPVAVPGKTGCEVGGVTL